MTSNRQRTNAIQLAKACRGRCLHHPGAVRSAAAACSRAPPGAAGLALFGIPGLAAAQDQPMIENLNLGGMGGGSNPQINFNPYSPNVLSNWIFETLYIVNDYDCLEIPWLASAYEWRDEQTLVFTMREGVTWHDGEAFGADDVAFTFNMIKEYPALDLNGAWTFLESVAAEGNDVVFSFAEVAIPEFFRMSEVRIVPEHQWSQVEDPLTFLNEEPVGTGPYMFGEFNGEQLTGVRFENHLLADRLRVQQVTWRKAGEGQTDQLRLAEGEYDWNAMFVPNVEQVFVAEDPENNHYWYAQGSSISLGMNLTKAPFDDVEFRKGISWAIDRDKIIQNAQLGYVTQASQTGLKLPGQQDWLNPKIENEGYLGLDLDRARQILTDAGYTWDGDTMLGLGRQPDRVPLHGALPAGPTGSRPARSSRRASRSWGSRSTWKPRMAASTTRTASPATTTPSSRSTAVSATCTPTSSTTSTRR